MPPLCLHRWICRLRVTYSFGAFFTSIGAEFHASHTAASIFFAITGMLFYFFGWVTRRLSDRFGPRPVISAGAIITGAGLTLTGAAPQIWTGYLAYGVGAGIGASCVYIPTVALVGQWFKRHRTTAQQRAGLADDADSTPPQHTHAADDGNE